LQKKIILVTQRGITLKMSVVKSVSLIANTTLNEKFYILDYGFAWACLRSLHSISYN